MAILIYHANCPDGFMSATIWRSSFGDSWIYYPGVHQEPPPDVKGHDVVFLDFSYKRPVILDMASKALSIKIIDHHLSAANDLVDLPSNVETIFDMDRSGAMLTWSYLNPNIIKPPLMVQYVQDADLWKWELPNSREVSANLRSYEYDFDVWNQFLRMTREDIDRFAAQGESIQRRHQKDVMDLVETGKHELVIGGIRVPAANLPYTMASEAGSLMAQDQPFSATYFYDGDGWVFGLRSRGEEGYDVSKIAVIYGGGGHKNAAGFKVDSLKDLEDYSV